MTIRTVAAVLAAMLSASPLLAQDDTGWLHAIAIDGEPKYAEGFAHFDYVNPEAPKSGTVRLSALGTFDTFNPVLNLGQAAIGLGLVYESLFTPSSDESSVMYGLLAEAVRHPLDHSSVTFRLNPAAYWHDGEPVTAEDVVWSFEQTIALSPGSAEYYAMVESAEITGEGEVTFTFSEAGNRELPYIMGQLIVLPRHWWEGENPQGTPRNIEASTLEPPLGSGPYRLEGFDAGRSVRYARVEDYWGAEEPVRIGTNNFDIYSYEYFRDTTVMFEAFAGDDFDWWTENIARRWATGYNFPAVRDGRVVLETFDNPYRAVGVMVGFVTNTRDEKFRNPLVREALNYAFDFEELNRTQFYGQYERVDSFFFGSELAAGDGPPTGLELDILEEVRGLVPDTVFTERFTNPVGGDEDAFRENLGQALALFREAGYTLDGTRLVDANGVQFGFEILIDGPTVESIALHLADNLNTIGANVRVTSADSNAFDNRVLSHDYEVAYLSWAQSLSPGNEQRDYWGSSSVDVQGSRNYGGVADPGVDALIERIVRAPDRETLVAATKALDRVLLAQHFIVPTYVISYARTARWDRFSHPETLPEYAIGFPSIWWWDADKAAATGGAAR